MNKKKVILTVTSITGTLYPGQTIQGAGVTAGTIIELGSLISIIAIVGPTLLVYEAKAKALKNGYELR